MDRRRNGARVQGVLRNFLCTVCGFRLAGSRYDKRRSRAFARPCFHRQGEAGSSGSQVNVRITIREERDDGQHIGRYRITDPGVPAGDNGTSEVDMVW